MKDNILNFIIDHWPQLAPLIYELIARLVPTKWNLSLIDNAWKLLNFIVPNIRKKQRTDILGVISKEGNKNTVNVPQKKHILYVLAIFALIGFSSQDINAQKWENFRGIRLVNVPDTLDPTVLAVEGSIMYAEDDTVFYGRFPSGWYPFGIGGGGGGLTTADNGLEVDPAGNVQLGGTPLIKNTEIDGDGSFNFGFLGVTAFGVQSSGAVTLESTTANVNIVANQLNQIISGAGTSVNATTVNQPVIFRVLEDGGATILTVNETAGSTNTVFTQTGTAGGVRITPNTNNQSNIFLVEADGGTDIFRISEAGSNTGATQFNGNNVWVNTSGTAANLTVTINATNNFQALDVHTLFQKPISATTSATLAGIHNIGVAADPSAPVDGDIWYNTTLGTLRTRNAGVSVSLPGAGGGITNTAANNELAKSDGTNLIPSGVFALPSDGNLQLGSAAIAGSRTLAVVSSTANAGLTLSSQGTGDVSLDANSTGQYNFGTSADAGITRTVNAVSSGGNTAFVFNTQGTGTYDVNAGGDITLTTTAATGDIELVANGAGAAFIALRSVNNQIIFDAPTMHFISSTFSATEDIIFDIASNSIRANSNTVPITPFTISSTDNTGSSGEDGGDLVLEGGTIGAATGSGAATTGSVTVTSGTVTAGNSNKTVGDLNLYTGELLGTGTPGNINIQARNGGAIRFPSLRTDCTGADPGDLFNDGGVLSLCP